MPQTVVDQRLAANFDVRNNQAVEFGLEAVRLVAVNYQQAFNQLMAITAHPGMQRQAIITRTMAILAPLQQRTMNTIDQRLMRVGLWGYDSAFEAIIDVLPDEFYEVPETLNFGAATDPTAARKLYRPPTRARVREIVESPTGGGIDLPGGGVGRHDGATWRSRINKWSMKVHDHEAVGVAIADGMATGKSPASIGRSIRTLVGGDKAAAERVARTEILRVSNEMGRETMKGFEHVLAGRKILATFDDLTRPHHAQRHGTIYIKAEFMQDFPGAQPLASLPVVPDEPNCRCTEVPVLKPKKKLFPKRKAVRASQFGEIRDPVTYARWFNALPSRGPQGLAAQRRVVGVRRMEIMAKKLGRAPEWQDVIDPTNGKLMLLKRLKAETIADHAARRRLVDALVHDIDQAVAAEIGTKIPKKFKPDPKLKKPKSAEDE